MSARACVHVRVSNREAIERREREEREREREREKERKREREKKRKIKRPFQPGHGKSRGVETQWRQSVVAPLAAASPPVCFVCFVRGMVLQVYKKG